MEDYDKDTKQGGVIAAGVRIFLQRRDSVGVAIQRRDMGGNNPHGPDPWGFPGPCGAEIDGEAPSVTDRQEVVVHLVIGGKGGGGV